MLTSCCILSVLVFTAAPGRVEAEAIDAGRGKLSLVVPKSYDKSKPAALVVLLHGYTSSGAGQDAYMKVSPLADTYGFLFIAPDGTREQSNAKHRFWNATKACCDLYGSNVDDSAYLLRVIDEVKKKVSVDPNRVYLIGHSNGGFMSHRMAVDHPDTIAAIAALNGAAPNMLAKAKPDRPVNILHIHGTKDRLNAYGGGEIRGVKYPGALETVTKWAKLYDLPTKAESAEKKLDLDSVLAGNETTITRFGDGAVELWTINEGGHVPKITATFTKNIIEWLLAHPKARKSD